ncbi:hypothetical protein LXL04_013374 [Taraxacum kok-saghyz]
MQRGKHYLKVGLEESNILGPYMSDAIIDISKSCEAFEAKEAAPSIAGVSVGALRTFQYEITKTYIQRLSSWMKASTEEVSRYESWVPVSVLGSRFFWQIWDQFCTGFCAVFPYRVLLFGSKTNQFGRDRNCALASTVCEVFGFNRQQLDDKIFKGQFRHSASFGNCKKKQDLRALTGSIMATVAINVVRGSRSFVEELLHEIKVVHDETGEDLPPGSKGIVKAKPPQIMQAYYKMSNKADVWMPLITATSDERQMFAASVEDTDKVEEKASK